MIRLFILFNLVSVFSLVSKNVPDSLISVDLQHKNLKAFPQNVSYTKLKSLAIGYNPISQLPSELLLAKQLDHLSINFDPQFDPISGMAIIRQLKLSSLEINNSALMYLPLELGDMKTLKHVSLANNFIKEVPEYIFMRGQFLSLNLEGNMITELPKQITTQNELNALNLSRNPCINTPVTYGYLSKLESLNKLEIRGVSALPDIIWNLKRIQYLDISEGSFDQIKLPTNFSGPEIKTLIAENCNTLNSEGFQTLIAIPSLTNIRIGGDNFHGFNNASLGALIKDLSLSGNSLDHFSFKQPLNELSSLVLNFNTINCANELVASLAKTKTIKALNLNHCGITFLPAQLSQLTQLESLNLSGNAIKNINELFSLKQLKELNVSDCELTKEQLEKLKKELPDTEITCQISYEKPALPNVQPKSESFTVLPSDPKTITTNNGTQIFIPKNSLVYDNGKPVKDPVNINFTSYYSLTDIAVSGINMNYQTGGQNTTFSSAGMFNISASANNQPVQLKKGSEMKIAFKSNDASQSYNYYVYDSIKRTWTETGKDTIRKIKVKAEETTAIADSVVNPARTKMPQPPAYYSCNNITISWDIDYKKRLTGFFTISTPNPNHKDALDTAKNVTYFTEIKELSRISWKLDLVKSSEAIKKFMKNNDLFTHTIEDRPLNLKPRYHYSTTKSEKNVDMQLVADKENDNFIFRFYDGTDTVEIAAYPVYQTKNTDREQQSIKKMFFKYKTLEAQRKSVTKYRRDKFQVAYNQFREQMSVYRTEFNNRQNKNLDQLLNTAVKDNTYEVTRVLTLQGFNIYNCDRPVNIENPLVFAPQLVDEKGHKLAGSGYQLIDPKENIAVYYFNDKKVKASRNSILTFLYMDRGNKVYVGKLSTFNLDKSKPEVAMTALAPEITVGELSSYINLSK